MQVSPSDASKCISDNIIKRFNSLDGWVDYLRKEFDGSFTDQQICNHIVRSYYISLLAVLRFSRDEPSKYDICIINAVHSHYKDVGMNHHIQSILEFYKNRKES